MRPHRPSRGAAAHRRARSGSRTAIRAAFLIVATLVFASSAVAVACRSTGLSSATGVVIAADGPSAADVDTFRLRTNDGQLYEFNVGALDLSGGGLPAPHIREHLVSGVPITVYYSTANGTLTA